MTNEEIQHEAHLMVGMVESDIVNRLRDIALRIHEEVIQDLEAIGHSDDSAGCIAMRYAVEVVRARRGGYSLVQAATS